jgi:adenylylsulfate kinase-like enzyme
VRALHLAGEIPFIEVYVNTPIETCETRDPKGLYKKARAGEITHFTGVDSPYEAPLAPDIRLDTTSATAEELADQLIARLRAGGYLGS